MEDNIFFISNAPGNTMQQGHNNLQNNLFLQIDQATEMFIINMMEETLEEPLGVNIEITTIIINITKVHLCWSQYCR